jgi:hypothetical protein
VPDLVLALVGAAVLVRLTRSYPPTQTQCWGAPYAKYDPYHVGASNPTLSLSDVITSDLLNDILYYLPPTLYLQWQGTLEVQSKMIFLGHQILSCHVPVVWSFFILWKMLLSS